MPIRSGSCSGAITKLRHRCAIRKSQASANSEVNETPITPRRVLAAITKARKPWGGLTPAQRRDDNHVAACAQFDYGLFSRER